MCFFFNLKKLENSDRALSFFGTLRWGLLKKMMVMMKWGRRRRKMAASCHSQSIMNHPCSISSSATEKIAFFVCFALLQPFFHSRSKLYCLCLIIINMDTVQGL